VGTGLTGEEHRSDRRATTQSGDFKAEDTRRDRMACVETTQGAVAGLEGLVALVIRKGHFRLSVASI
jgi:hypothetical protein